MHRLCGGCRMVHCATLNAPYARYDMSNMSNMSIVTPKEHFMIHHGKKQ